MENLDINIKIKNFKLNFLQHRYKYLTELIVGLEKHIDTLYINNYFELSYKNQILCDLFIITKNLNSGYNLYITNNLDTKTIINNKIYDIVNLFSEEITNEFMFENIAKIIQNDPINIPLYDQENEIKKIIQEVGYNNLNELLNIFNNQIKLSHKQNQLVNEIIKIFVPTKIRSFNVKTNLGEYYWRIPNIWSDLDILLLNRELWILNSNSENQDTNDYIYFKIEGFFINDSLSCFMKSSQINYPILYNLKEDIYKELSESSVDLKFVKKFIRYDYLGNIYCMNTNEYVKLIEKSFENFIEVKSLSFINIMKNFISKGAEIKSMFEYIFLLLLGSLDNIDIAELLLGLIKEKKSNNLQVYNFIIQRLPYYLIVKLKKSSNLFKIELNKIKSLSIDDVDYKKQLITNKNIPELVKNLTLEKIEEMKSFNNEYYKQLCFVKHIINYPWPSDQDDIFFNHINKDTNESLKYLCNIEDKLTKLSYGHDEAKKGLLQTIGKWITNPSSQGTCFGLVGPPGVGKTLLAKSVSKALNIPFAEITLGGQNDGEILHGHGYTYSGSQPGLIIKKMVEMGKSRCILYFDELDKACSKHGAINEITSILIHLTDPNMNKTFQDRFFQGIDFPLDKVIMIFSYNDSNLVDPILIDRLKQIDVGAYTLSDKKKIVREFIIPEIAESIGLSNELWINLADDLIEFIIENYTNEAGVRSIKRKIEQIFLTLNLDKIYKREEFINKNIDTITKEMILRILDKPKYNSISIHEKPCVGIINGLYATSSGDGGIIPIQIFNNFAPNTNQYEIKLTGKQGDVMKESVHCSLTTAIDYLHRKSNIKNITEYLTTNFSHGFHVHAPATSTPKDGPSAGCAFTCAFISRILNKPIKNDIAMTGEIELTGKITKIGGLNFKLIGAKKAGIKLVYIPKENEKDLQEINIKYPTLITNDFKVKYFDYIDEIIDEILL